MSLAPFQCRDATHLVRTFSGAWQFSPSHSHSISTPHCPAHPSRPRSAEVTRVNTTQQLSELRKAHPVIFLLVHDWEVDRDWHGTYTKVAMEKALRGKFCYTTEPGIVEVRLGKEREGKGRVGPFLGLQIRGWPGNTSRLADIGMRLDWLKYGNFCIFMALYPPTPV